MRRSELRRRVGLVFQFPEQALFASTVAEHAGKAATEKARADAAEARVTELGGHKSLYSEAFYPRDVFDRLYGGANLAAVQQRYDPAGRLTDLYDKVVRTP